MNRRSHAESFRYHALTEQGEARRGTIAAADENDARRELTDRGWLLIEFSAIGHGWTGASRIGAQDLALGLRILANLVDSGMAMIDVLATFADLAPRSWTSALPSVSHGVAGGRSLSQSLAATNALGIPPTALGLIRAGEAGSGLANGLREAAVWAETRSADRAALRNACAYPAIVAGVGMASIGIMVGVVLPKFARMLADLEQTPPPLTVAVLRVAEAAKAAAMPSIALGLLGVAVLLVARNRPDGQRRWREFLLRVPGFGQFWLASVSSHVLASLAALLGNGVPMSAAIPLAGEASGDPAIERRILLAGERVAAGESLAKALTASRAISPTSLRLVAAGEASGRLVDMLIHAAVLERSRTAEMTRQFLRVLEPMLLLLVSGTVAVIATAMLQAIYSIKPAS